jgi:uridine monophosphate synthetase
VKRALALGLFAIGAISFGHFRLKLHEEFPDAPLSPIYIDLRVLRSFPSVMDYAILVYDELSTGITFDLYADVPTAATPIVAILSYKNRIPMVSPRKDEKRHGIKRSVDGAFRQDQIVLLVDDLITLASSKLDAISVLEENGLRVKDVVVLVDREQGGVQELNRRGYACHVAFRLRELLELYLDSGKISHGQYLETVEYLEKSKF